MLDHLILPYILCGLNLSMRSIIMLTLTNLRISKKRNLHDKSLYRNVLK